MAHKPSKFIDIEVDGQNLSVRADQYLLWSLRDAGFDIPHFCAHKWLEPFGGCRMCLVQIEMGGRMMPKLQTSCSTKPAEGMRVFTNTAPVLAVRKEQLEFHLLNHPLECPVCDKGGECMLQNQTMDHGWAAGRYGEQKRIRPDTVFNDYIRMNYKRCIHCKRCIHYCADIDGSHLLQFIDRGADTYIESFPNPDEAPRFSGNVIDICPVGALTARSYRFMGRPWEQEHTASVGSLDSVGANIWICNRIGRVARIIPRDNPDVEYGYIDDVTRFHWECFEDDRRLRRAIVRANGEERQVSIAAGDEEAGALLASVLGEHGPDSVGVIAGGGLGCEDYLALRRFAVDSLNSSYYFFGSELAGRDGPNLPALRTLVHEHATISQTLNASTVLVIGCDLFEEAPALGLRLDIAARRGQLNLLVARDHKSDNDRFASLKAEYAPGNLQRFLQGLINAFNGIGDMPPETLMLADKLRSIGDDLVIVFGDSVWRSEHPETLINLLAVLRGRVADANPNCQGVYLCPVLPEVNSAGALLLSNLEQFAALPLPKDRKSAGSLRKVLEAAAEKKLKALVIFDADILSCYPDRALVDRALAATRVIYCGPFANPTSERAELHLPLGTYAHSEGTVLSLEWRLQMRHRSLLDTVVPSVLDVLDALCSALHAGAVGETYDELALKLAELIPGWPAAPLSMFPPAGVLLNLPRAAADSPRGDEGVMPAEFKPSAEEPLVLLPKRFLYNDRQELRFSRVFDNVWRPYCAFLNPVDMKVHNLAEGETVSLVAGGRALELPVKGAGWVKAGSVVVNDYCLAAPANQLAGWQPLRVALKKKVRAGGGS